MSMVKAAMTSSALGRYQRPAVVGCGIPKVDLPRARRMMLSKCSRAALVAGDEVADSTDNAVAVEVRGGGT